MRKTRWEWIKKSLLKQQNNSIIEGGNYIETTCNATGVSKPTFYSWLQRGAIALRLKEKEKKVPENEKLFLQFLQLIKQAIVNY